MYAAYGGFLGCDIRNVGVCEEVVSSYEIF